MNNNKITEKSIKKLLDQLSVCTKLKSLEIVDNNINNNGEILERIRNIL